MVKAINKIELETKKSSKGTNYTVCNVILSNGITHQADGFISQETMDLINVYGVDKVKYDYVENISKDGKKYSSILIEIPELEFKEILFLKKSTVALIEYLGKNQKG